MSAYFCTSSVVWAGRDVYPTTESLDATRTGIHHHVMNTTPLLPSMRSHMSLFPCYRFWEFIYRFTGQDACFYMKHRSKTYLLQGEFSLFLTSSTSIKASVGRRSGSFARTLSFRVLGHWVLDDFFEGWFIHSGALVSWMCVCINIYIYIPTLPGYHYTWGKCSGDRFRWKWTSPINVPI